MNDDDFKSAKAEIKLGDEKIKTKKITYTLTNENISQLGLSVLKDLKEDKKFIESLARLTSEDEESIKDTISEMIDSMDEEDFEDDETITELSVYTKGLL